MLSLREALVMWESDIKCHLEPLAKGLARFSSFHSEWTSEGFAMT